MSGHEAMTFGVGYFYLAIRGRLKGMYVFSYIMDGDIFFLFHKRVGWFWSHCISKRDVSIALSTARKYLPAFLLPFLISLDIYPVMALGTLPIPAAFT